MGLKKLIQNFSLIIIVLIAQACSDGGGNLKLMSGEEQSAVFDEGKRDKVPTADDDSFSDGLLEGEGIVSEGDSPRVPQVPPVRVPQSPEEEGDRSELDEEESQEDGEEVLEDELPSGVQNPGEPSGSSNDGNREENNQNPEEISGENSDQGSAEDAEGDESEIEDRPLVDNPEGEENVEVPVEGDQGSGSELNPDNPVEGSGSDGDVNPLDPSNPIEPEEELDPSEEIPEASCGNGILEAGEQCDDGNLINGDGCKVNCNIELSFVCEGEPSVCQSQHQENPEEQNLEDELCEKSNVAISTKDVIMGETEALESPSILRAYQDIGLELDAWPQAMQSCAEAVLSHYDFQSLSHKQRYHAYNNVLVTLLRAYSGELVTLFKSMELEDAEMLKASCQGILDVSYVVQELSCSSQLTYSLKSVRNDEAYLEIIRNENSALLENRFDQDRMLSNWATSLDMQLNNIETTVLSMIRQVKDNVGNLTANYMLDTSCHQLTKEQYDRFISETGLERNPSCFYTGPRRNCECVVIHEAEAGRHALWRDVLSPSLNWSEERFDDFHDNLPRQVPSCLKEADVRALKDSGSVHLSHVPVNQFLECPLINTATHQKMSFGFKNNLNVQEIGADQLNALSYLTSWSVDELKNFLSQSHSKRLPGCFDEFDNFSLMNAITPYIDLNSIVSFENDERYCRNVRQWSGSPNKRLYKLVLTKVNPEHFLNNNNIEKRDAILNVLTDQNIFDLDRNTLKEELKGMAMDLSSYEFNNCINANHASEILTSLSQNEVEGFYRQGSRAECGLE